MKVYELLQELNPHKLNDLCKAHRCLVNGLIDTAGKLRTKNLGIVKGSEVAHIAPGGNMVKGLLGDLFDYIKNENDLILIKSCVFHYELEFIHPFIDGNGRMGRLWQTLILIQQYPALEYLPAETLIKNKQEEYYNVLAISDKSGNSTPFIEFMLAIILEALKRVLPSQNKSVTKDDRISIFRDKMKKEDFGRKEYLKNFKNISQATASRDLN
ncbi:Fic family protein [Aquimarina celericrescens]|uniref:Fic family protein n=1 Tax=Aquimarina celericrescens TaxID=1964542 RepID=A0ABW5B0D2_9FLAO